MSRDRNDKGKPGDRGAARAALLAQLWSDDDGGTRGPKRSRSRDDVVDEAIALADIGGIGAVSMGAVAKRLGLTSMSLYRYVNSKDDLLVMMVDRAGGNPPETVAVAPTWQEAMTLWSRALKSAYLAHPWMLEVPIDGPPLGPGQLAWLEAFMQGVSSSGLADHEILSCALLVSAYVRSDAELERDVMKYAEEIGTVTAERVAIVVEGMRRRGGYPAVMAMLEAGYFEDDAPDTEFDFGLERILDGIAAFIARKA